MWPRDGYLISSNNVKDVHDVVDIDDAFLMHVKLGMTYKDIIKSLTWINGSIIGCGS